MINGLLFQNTFQYFVNLLGAADNVVTAPVIVTLICITGCLSFIEHLLTFVSFPLAQMSSIMTMVFFGLTVVSYLFEVLGTLVDVDLKEEMKQFRVVLGMPLVCLAWAFGQPIAMFKAVGKALLGALKLGMNVLFDFFFPESYKNKDPKDQTTTSNGAVRSSSLAVVVKQNDDNVSNKPFVKVLNTDGSQLVGKASVTKEKAQQSGQALVPS